MNNPIIKTNGIVNALNRIIEKLGALTISIGGDQNDYVCKVQRTTAQSIANATNVKIQFDKKIFDPTNCFDNITNYRFVAQVAGYYQINGNIRFATNNVTGAYRSATIWKNGATVAQGSGSILHATAVNSSSVSSLEYLEKGDYIELYAYQDSGGAINTDINYTCQLSIAKINKYSAITPTQSPYKARMLASTLQSLPNVTASKINMDTKVYDPSNMIDLPNKQMIIPVSGWWQVSGMGIVDFGAIAVSTFGFSTLYKNGAEIQRGQRIDETAGSKGLFYSPFSDCLYFNKGDIIDLRMYQGNGSSLARNSETGLVNAFLAMHLLST